MDVSDLGNHSNASHVRFLKTASLLLLSAVLYFTFIPNNNKSINTLSRHRLIDKKESGNQPPHSSFSELNYEITGTDANLLFQFINTYTFLRASTHATTTSNIMIKSKSSKDVLPNYSKIFLIKKAFDENLEIDPSTHQLMCEAAANHWYNRIKPAIDIHLQDIWRIHPQEQIVKNYILHTHVDKKDDLKVITHNCMTTVPLVSFLTSLALYSQAYPELYDYETFNEHGKMVRNYISSIPGNKRWPTREVQVTLLELVFMKVAREDPETLAAIMPWIKAHVMWSFASLWKRITWFKNPEFNKDKDHCTPTKHQYLEDQLNIKCLKLLEDALNREGSINKHDIQDTLFRAIYLQFMLYDLLNELSNEERFMQTSQEIMGLKQSMQIILSQLNNHEDVIEENAKNTIKDSKIQNSKSVHVSDFSDG